MAKNNNLTDFLTDVADAIRVKRDKTDLINPQDFHDEILAIETGSSGPIIEGNGEYEVVFIDFDGTELKKQYVNEGESATPPTPPEHEHMTFNKWVGNYNNVSHDTVIGAHYVSSDNKLWLYYRNSKKVNVKLYIQNSRATIDWNDGTVTNVPKYAPNDNIHIYNDNGPHWVSITITEKNSSISLYPSLYDGIIMGNGDISISDTESCFWIVFNDTWKQIISTGSLREMKAMAIILPTSYAGTFEFMDCYPLKYLVCDITDLRLTRCNGLLMLNNNANTGANVSTSHGTRSSLSYYYEYATKSICPRCINLIRCILDVASYSGTSYYSDNNYGYVGELVLTSRVASFTSDAFSEKIYINNMIIKNPTPPSIPSDIESIPDTFYVPDASVQAYKTATGWSSYATRIKGISELY